jgi:TLD
MTNEMGELSKAEAKQSLADALRKCMKSLTPAESFFLQALLDDHGAVVEDGDDSSAVNTVDAVDLNKKQTLYLTRAASRLADDTLFVKDNDAVSPPLSTVEVKVPPKARRPSNLGLWKAYQDGVHPNQLVRRSSRSGLSNSHYSSRISTSDMLAMKDAVEELQQSENDGLPTNEKVADIEVASDTEIRAEKNDDGSSWDSQEDADHLKFDAWEVLRDEYASDFGFNFTSPPSKNTTSGNAVDDLPNYFQILGTSALDITIQPHVMSPPMMDALMSFLPDSIIGQNFWLRFSLIRDGASLDTMKRYVRAAECTILAIETRNGDVFGSFTSSPWHNHHGFFGSAPAFVWKMRHSRRTKCISLFDQAQLESEIDVYLAQGGRGVHTQVCRHDMIAVGGDENLIVNLADFNSIREVADKSGFAFCLDSDLLRGTTSRSQTFHNPSLCGPGNKSEVFEVAGLEVWSLTPCFSVEAAEKLEMTKFFIEESVRNLAVPRTPYNSIRSASNFTNDDLDQEKFYQRVGHDSDGQARRARWEYVNTMQTVGEQSNRGFSASPRFGYDKTE